MKEVSFNKNYLISENGDIFSKYRGIYLSATVDNSKYFRVNLWDPVYKKTTKHLVHRLVATAYIENPEGLPQVNHIDGNKLNNYYTNLEWVTCSENQIHAYEIGLKKIPKGSLNGRATRDEETVREIYQELLKGRSAKEVAKEYGVKGGLISDIKAKRAWSHALKGLPDCDIKHKSKPLSEDIVVVICEMFENGCQIKDIFSVLKSSGVTKDQICDIKRRKCHKKISNNYHW